MIALEVSSAAGRPPYGGIGSAIRNTVSELLRIDPETRYLLCNRLSRWRKGNLFRPDAANVGVRMVQDPLNALLIPGARLFHSMGAFLPQTPRISKIVTINDLNAVRNPEWCSPEWHQKRSRRFREVVARTDHVFTLSPFMASEIRDEYGLPKEVVHAIPCGVDTAAYRPPTRDVVERVRGRYGDFVISIGLLTPRKNFPRLIDAMAAFEDLKLLLVGRGSDGEGAVEQAIDRHRMRDRVVRLDGIGHGDLVDLIGSARACVVPSLYEGFGLTTLEAMACGTPVISSRASALPDAAGDAAHYVDATDVVAISEGIREVIGDEDLASDLRARGLARARGHTWEKTARRHRALYRQIAGV